MIRDNGDDGGNVSVTMELSGEYDDVVSRIAVDERNQSELKAVMQDFERLLDTLTAIDGGTKSVVVENLPGEMAAEYDSDTVVYALQTLERYGLVTLDGNTWKVAE